MQLSEGDIVEGKVTGITKFGAFVELEPGVTGMVHISEVAPTFVREIGEHLSEGQTVRAMVLSVGENGKIALSIKRLAAPRKSSPPVRRDRDRAMPKGDSQPQSFEDMLSQFKQKSDERMSDLKRTMEGKHGGYSRRRGSRG